MHVLGLTLYKMGNNENNLLSEEAICDKPQVDWWEEDVFFFLSFLEEKYLRLRIDSISICTGDENCE